MHGAQHRVADRGAALAVRRLVDEHHAMLAQELERGGAVVGEGPDDLAVVVAVVRKAVGLHHRPIGEVLEHQVGRILDAVALLHAGAAAERHVAAAHPRVAADMRLRLDHDHRGARFLGRDRGRETGRARADDDDVGLAMPLGGGCCACADAGAARPPAPNAAAVPPRTSNSRRIQGHGNPPLWFLLDVHKRHPRSVSNNSVLCHEAAPPSTGYGVTRSFAREHRRVGTSGRSRPSSRAMGGRETSIDAPRRVRRAQAELVNLPRDLAWARRHGPSKTGVNALSAPLSARHAIPVDRNPA